MSQRRLAFRLIAGLLGCGALTGAAQAQLPVEVHKNQAELLQSADATLLANKKLVFDFWREVLQAHRTEHIGDFVAEDFVEHDPTLPNGRAGLTERVGRLPAQAVQPTLDELVSIVAEGDRVVVATRRELPDLAEEGQTYTTTWFDLFRISGGKIVEHWNFGPRD
jgi:predicted SnoaL-like aldol condensation-catalyzing enzyme